jgi:hypothetical protein
MDEFKSRLKDKNLIIDEKNRIIETKDIEIEELNSVILSLKKRINSHNLITSELELVLQNQESLITSLQQENEKWIRDKEEQQKVLLRQFGNNDAVVAKLQDELINIKNRLKKYEKVD